MSTTFKFSLVPTGCVYVQVWWDNEKNVIVVAGPYLIFDPFPKEVNWCCPLLFFVVVF